LVSAQGETLALTTAHTVMVGGRISAPDQAKLRPLAPLAGLRGFPVLAVILGVAGLALLAAGLLLWRRRRSEALGPPAPPPIRPEVEFRDGLEALLGRRLREEGRMRAFTQELSWILRRYLGRRWQHPALEATRPEILRWLPRTEMSVADQQEVAGWLEATDRIKFAGAVPLLTETDALVDKARHVVSRGQELAAERERREAEAERAAALAAGVEDPAPGRDGSRAARKREGRR
jgi:LPXTG-motif cell wall-anchored protein